MIPREKWQWFGYPGHFVCGERCVFHLVTRVGPWVVSTVGDFHPNRDEKVERVNGTSLFETMVFRVKRKCGCGCGAPDHDGDAVDEVRSDTAAEARKAHMRLCAKWARREAPR